MLRQLRIRRLVLVDDLCLEFGPGLNLLTGETGAGKSILVDAVGLAVGGRGDRVLVRAGESSAIVEALFELEPDSAARQLACAQGWVTTEESELIVRREISVAGANTIRVNGSPCTRSQLRELGGSLLELHGQHEQQTLLSPDRHLELLDRFADHDPLRERVARAFRAHDEARQRVEGMERLAEERLDRLDRLQRTVTEIEAVGPRPGELTELEREQRVLANAGRLAELLDELVRLAYDSEGAAAAVTARAARLGREVAQIDPTMADASERLAAAAIEIEDAGATFRDYRQQRSFDPARLDEIEGRRVAIDRLCLQYGGDEAALQRTLAEARQELEELQAIDDRLAEARSCLGRTARGYAGEARRLGESRRLAVRRIVAAVESQLKELAMPGARIDVKLDDGPQRPSIDVDGRKVALSPRGAERAELMLAANRGEPFRPLRKVASGGELSRLMLALHMVFRGSATDKTLVFDEVDTGVGGAVADAIGERLAGLGTGQQVLCVTHLPQVAAHADSHFNVSKREVAGRPRVEVGALDGDERIEELARMLGGRRSTESSRRHARELLATAGRRTVRRRRRA